MLFSLAFVCTAVIRAQEGSTKDRNQTIKVDVGLVLVDATVSDSKGRIVTGLEQENFRIWEDKTEQKVEYFSSEDTPMSIGLNDAFLCTTIPGSLVQRGRPIRCRRSSKRGSERRGSKPARSRTLGLNRSS